MNFEWQDYLLLAKQLRGDSFANDLSIAKMRSAISRAYYAAYNLAYFHISKYCHIDYRSEQIKNIRKSLEIGDHDLTSKLMQTSDSDQMRLLGSRLFTLKGKRLKADYYSNPIEKINRETRDAIMIAEMIINGLSLFEKGQANVNLKLLDSLLK